MQKSRLDILIERRILTEKHSIAAKAVDFIIKSHAPNNTAPFIAELDSNKVMAFIYPNDKEVDIHLGILLDASMLHRNLIPEIKKHIDKSRDRELPTQWNQQGFAPTTIQEFIEDYTLFTYSARAGGAAVLNAMLKETIMNTLALEALRIEKFIIDFGR